MSNIDWAPELAATLDRLVPPGGGAYPDWVDVVTRVGGSGRRAQRRQRLHGLRLALVVVLLFLFVTGAATATYLLVHDNGSLVFASRFGQLLVADPDGPALRTIEPCAGGNSSCSIAEPAWSPDGTRLAFVSGPDPKSQMFLYVVAADGRHPRRLASCGSCGEQWNGRLGWSPDGKRIAFSRDAGPRGQQSLWTISAAGGGLHRLTHCRRCFDVEPTWSPNGKALAFVRGAGLYTSGLYILRPGSRVTRIARDPVIDPAWSPDGRWITYGRAVGFAIASADGFDSRIYFDLARSNGATNPSWSPDGRKLVFFRTPGRRGHFRVEVWTMNVDGSGLKRLYRSGCCATVEAAPIWSPDGRMIAFSASSAGGTYVMNADGTGLRRLSTTVSDSLSWQKRPMR